MFSNFPSCLFINLYSSFKNLHFELLALLMPIIQHSHLLIEINLKKVSKELKFFHVPSYISSSQENSSVVIFFVFLFLIPFSSTFFNRASLSCF